FYEERGLIASVGRHGLKRVFGPNVLDRLALIALGREAGLSLDEIAPMLGTGRAPRIDRSVLANKADAIDRSIRKLVAMRDGLRHAAVCSAPSHMECPTFRRLMGLAVARNARRAGSMGRVKGVESVDGARSTARSRKRPAVKKKGGV